MGYLGRVTSALTGEPIALPDQLARVYPDLAILSLRRGGLPTRIAGWFLGQSGVAAITLRRTIYFGAHTRIDAPLLLHELRHVEQFRERKSFPVRYIWESLRRGYHQNRYEVDARAYASRRLGQADRPPPVEEV
jgi:hypothetical protein